MINTNTILIAVDSGKDATKYQFNNGVSLERGIFKTKVQQVENMGVEMQGKTSLVELDGKTFMIGDMVSDKKLNFDLSKKSIEHKLCIYLAVSKALSKNKADNVILAVGTPLSIYKNEKLKQEYRDYIYNNGEVNIKVNNEEVKFKIKEVTILPESTGPIYANINEYRNEKVTVIDIGGLNSNICQYNCLVPQIDKMLCCNMGANILKSKIGDELSQRYGITIYREDVDQILKDGVLYIQGKQQEDSPNTIKKLMSEHLTNITNFCKQNELDVLKNGKIVFSGGGSLLLKEIIQEKYSYAKIATDAQFSNVQAFYKVLSIKNEG